MIDFLRDDQGTHPSITTAPAAPAMQNQNPAEREIQTMIKQVGAIMADQYTLGPSSWDYAVAYWTKTHNAMPNSLTDTFSPYQLVTGAKPDVAKQFRFPFGCPVTATNILGRKGNTYDVINEFGIAIGSSDSGNGATKIIIPGRPTQPYFERFHVQPLKLPTTSPSTAEMANLTPTFTADGVEFHTPTIKDIADPTLEPIPGSTLGYTHYDIPTTREEVRATRAHDPPSPTSPIPAATPTETHPNPLIGRRVRKTFPNHGTYEGTITQADSDYYSVRYDDGDIEDKVPRVDETRGKTRHL